jgi:hypothetical protein
MSAGGDVGAFKVVNSWGINWGAKWDGYGYYWMTYKAFTELTYPVILPYDRVDYEPELIAVFNFTGNCSRDSDITLGIGNASAPDDTIEYEWYGGKHNYPDFMCLDISEFRNEVGLNSYFLKVGTGVNKTSIASFKLELYENGYSINNPTVVSNESPDIPKPTPGTVKNTFDGYYVQIDEPDQDRFYGGNVTLTGNAAASVEKTILYDDFETEFPGDWILGDSNPKEGENYWQNTTRRSKSGYRSVWCAEEQQPVFEENFNTGGTIPTGWTTFSAGPNNHPWTVNNSGYNYLYGDPDYGAVCDSNAAGPGTNITEWLYMTNSFNASNVTSMYLEFFLDYDALSGVGEYAKVLYSYDSQYPTFYYLNTWTSDTIGKQQIDLSAAAGKNKVYIAFLYHGTYDNYMFVDDVRVLANLTSTNYANEMSAYMYIETNLTAYDSINLTYDYFLITEANHDYLYVIYYDDKSWYYIDPHTGNSNGWRSSWIEIPTNATYIGFFFDTDKLVNYEGAYLDNVKLLGSINLSSIEVKTDLTGWHNATGISNWACSLNTTDYPDAGYNITVRARYDSQYSHDYGRFKTDNTMPISFTPLADPGVWTSNSQLSISFATSDSRSGMDHYEINIDDGTFYNATNPYQLPSLSDGIHNISVRAYDAAGNIRTENVYVYIDCTSPDSFSPVADPVGWTSDTTPTIYFSTTDDASGIDHYELKIDSGSFSERTSPYSVPSLSNGMHTVYVQAFDKADNYVSGSVDVFIDANLPQPLTISADPDTWSSNTQPTITFSSSDSISSIDHYDLKIDDSAFGRQKSPYKLPPLSDGVHTITVRAYDKAFNYVEGDVTVYIDSTPPEAFSPSVSPEGWSSNTTPVLTFSTLDITGEIDRYEVKIDGGAFSVRESPYVFPTLKDGIHIITVRAYDVAGNYIDGFVSVYIDTEPPVSFTPAADPDAWTSDNQPQISFSTSDKTSGIDYYNVKIDDGSYFRQDSPYKLPRLSDGKHIIEVRAYDMVGHYIDGTTNVYIDTGKPDLDLTNFENDTWFIDSNVHIEWTYSDTVSGVDEVAIQLNDDSAIDKGKEYFHDFSDLTEGRYKFKITVYDQAQNSRSKQIEFGIDSTPPSLSILQPVEDSYIANDSVQFVWESADTLSGINHYEFKLDNGDYIIFNDRTSHTINSLKSGEHTVKIKAVDNAGNVIENKLKFYIDTLKPEVQSFTITDMEYDIGNNLFDFNCSWSAVDEGSGIDYYLIKLDDDKYLNSGTITSKIYTDVSIGFHTFYIKVYDKVGNYREFSFKTTLNPPFEGIDSDKDGLPDSIDPDDDNDGYYDKEEIDANTDPLNSDKHPFEKIETKTSEAGGIGLTEIGIIVLIILLSLILTLIFLNKVKGIGPFPGFKKDEFERTPDGTTKKQKEIRSIKRVKKIRERENNIDWNNRDYKY